MRHIFDAQPQLALRYQVHLQHGKARGLLSNMASNMVILTDSDHPKWPFNAALWSKIQAYDFKIF